jgi:hypothetical protein
MPERRATVGGEHYFITVDQKSKSVWVAVGDYMARRSGSRVEARVRPSSAGAKPQSIEAIEAERDTDATKEEIL